MNKMLNVIQHYKWGSKVALTNLYGIANPTNQPIAEVWMGAHPKGSSRIFDNKGKEQSLLEVIKKNPDKLLGKFVSGRFGELPFQFKVICANEPLSVQVHPNKNSAKIGFSRENCAGIPINAINRNYKDSNHKPELVFSVTRFHAMNGFREISDMFSLLQPLENAHPSIAIFLKNPDKKYLAKLFSDLFSMQGKQKAFALNVLRSVLAYRNDYPWDTINMLSKIYPNDTGLFSPLLLNVITLQPGEAMFVFPETPHAYLKGVALEVMANSDNVLRAGLTYKHIDLPEVIANLKLEPISVPNLLIKAIIKKNMQIYPVPVEDFSFTIHFLSSSVKVLKKSSAVIIFCIDGHAILSNRKKSLVLNACESAFIPANEPIIMISGIGRLACIYNQF